MRRKTHERRVGRRTKENRNTGGGGEKSGAGRKMLSTR